jgi:natural product biosynthesis luciferase-like monooxygenase protein
MTVRSCVFVGAESLLIECAQIWTRAGHQVAGIVSGNNAVRRHAQQAGIAHWPDVAAWLAAPPTAPLDHLFAVTHLAVLPAEALARPRVSAINFHDAPLPDYAGLNTPVWALLDGQTEHGVTWHLITAEVDRGDVLVQQRFVIADNETALTLNTKCFEAGIDTFESLVAKLTDGSLQAQAQTSAPLRMKRRKDRPAAAGVLDWSRSAADLQRVVQALDFGTYANPVAAAKVLHDQGVWVVGGLEVTAQPSTQAPGTVVALDDHGATVATADQDVRLLSLLSTCGRALPWPWLQEQSALRVGVRLPLLGAAGAQAIDAAVAATAAHEPFWLSMLAGQSALELPQIDRSAAAQAVTHHTLDVASPQAVAALAPEARLATLLGWMGRVADKDVFDVGLRTRSAAPAGLFAEEAPLRAQLDFTQSLHANAVRAGQALADAERRGGYLADLVARTPELRARMHERDPRALPVSVQTVPSLDDARAHASSELTVGLSADSSASRWIYDAAKLSAAQVGALQQQWLTLALAAAAQPERAVGELPLMNDALAERVLRGWNSATASVDHTACIHRLIEAQAARTPERVAVTSGGQSLSYAQLDQRANHLAAHLASCGVGPDKLVGLSMPRGIDLMVGLLAIHKAGGAYVPLDPEYPADRLAYMLADSKAAVLLTHSAVKDRVAAGAARVVVIDELPAAPAVVARHDGGATAENLAYVIYTSGSTGKPKGVMIEHRNVVNFYAGMDVHLAEDGPGTWLAVTSLSFDISVLELTWTLARGYTVVVARDEDRLALATPAAAAPKKPIDFSLFYFSADEAQGGANKYKLLLEGAKYADRNGFKAVWTPERHFHAFGGLYPNPAVTGAAVAAVTQHVGIRAGSVVLPLHHPARVAEEWSVVDNISQGRVGISFASGWQPNDFVLKPENFKDNKNVMLRNIEVVRQLWRGQAVTFDNPLGEKVETRTLPRPVQKELPYWVTSAGNPQTFIDAGRIGANVLTHLLGQTVEELGDKIAAYRKAYKDAGHQGEGYVSLMLHSFVAPDMAFVRATVKQPLIDYLKTSLNLVKQYAWTFPAFKRREGMDASQGSVDLQSLAADEMDALMEYSFERYFEGSGLFGTPESCGAMVERIKAVGVDDVACLIDFGIDGDTVLAHLPHLNRLRALSQPSVNADGVPLAELMQRHQVTHLQCTPSMARLLAQDEASRAGLAKLKRLMVGGEAFPPALAQDLAGLVAGKVMNMYGPTETTIWSAVHTVERGEQGVIPLGKPLANQQIHILDSRRQPLPPGVPGELAIGGDGVVRGYFERPELTADRFVPDTVRGQGRLYRTGDLARWTEDGRLEFLGRLDFQIKLRGYRIELGEIEAALSNQPGVAQAVVTAREDTPGDVRLVAYLVAHAGAAVEPNALRDALRADLPDFMVPAHVMVLPEFPHTPNGKIDRKALPAPDSQAAKTQAEFVAPQSDLQAQIAAVWQDVLKLPQVGISDNFFDLGGHSLLAVQAHRRLREALQRELSITDIFRFPTIAGLAQYLGGEVETGAKEGAERAQGRRAAMQKRAQLRSGSRA